MKNKKFEGVARNIMGSGIKSVDDFLESSDTEKSRNLQNTQSQIAKEGAGVQLIAPEKVPDEPKIQEQPATPVADPKTETAQPTAAAEKVVVSVYISTDSSYKLEDLKTKMRRGAPRSLFSKINKSSIMEAAIEMIATKFEEEGFKGVFPKLSE